MSKVTRRRRKNLFGPTLTDFSRFLSWINACTESPLTLLVPECLERIEVCRAAGGQIASKRSHCRKQQRQADERGRISSFHSKEQGSEGAGQQESNGQANSKT